MPAPPSERSDAMALKQAPTVKATVTPETRIVVATDMSSPGADRFRYLRMRLRELRSAGNVRTVLVTSAVPQDGKSTVAMNLATVLADGGKSVVCLVEGDLHRPAIANALGLEATRGLAECVEQGLNPLSLVQKVDPLGWYLLQAGAASVNPTETLQDDALGAVLESIRQQFDWVVIDTPPLAVLTDALLLGRYADTSLMVVRAESTPKAAVDEALARLGTKHVFGIVVNGEVELNDAARKYAGYYRYKRPAINTES